MEGGGGRLYSAEESGGGLVAGPPHTQYRLSIGRAIVTTNTWVNA